MSPLRSLVGFSEMDWEKVSLSSKTALMKTPNFGTGQIKIKPSFWPFFLKINLLSSHLLLGVIKD